MPILTIRGQLGSGAPEIGKQVADRLHIDYIDREVIAKVSELLNKSEQEIIAKEMLPNSLWGRIARALGFDNAAGESCVMGTGFISPYAGAYLPTWQFPLDDSRYLTGLESVIKELAQNQHVVIRGRGSQFILRDHPEALHILVTAPFETRRYRIMQGMELDKDSAEKEIAHSDGSRREFIRRYFHADMEDPTHYDMVLNTERFSFEDVASIIVNAHSIRNGK
jgi:cytidylate kinase